MLELVGFELHNFRNLQTVKNDIELQDRRKISSSQFFFVVALSIQTAWNIDCPEFQDLMPIDRQIFYCQTNFLSIRFSKVFQLHDALFKLLGQKLSWQQLETPSTEIPNIETENRQRSMKHSSLRFRKFSFYFDASNSKLRPPIRVCVKSHISVTILSHTLQTAWVKRLQHNTQKKTPKFVPQGRVGVKFISEISQAIHVHTTTDN